MEKENSNEHKHECCMKKNQEQKGFQKYLLVIMVGAVLLMSIVQSFQINSLKSLQLSNQITGNAVSGGIDMSGWTEDEKMMYEHHGTLPARLQGSQQQSSNMVGGC